MYFVYLMGVQLQLFLVTLQRLLCEIVFLNSSRNYVARKSSPAKYTKSTLIHNFNIPIFDQSFWYFSIAERLAMAMTIMLTLTSNFSSERRYNRVISYVERSC